MPIPRQRRGWWGSLLERWPWCLPNTKPIPPRGLLLGIPMGKTHIFDDYHWVCHITNLWFLNIVDWCFFGFVSQSFCLWSQGLSVFLLCFSMFSSLEWFTSNDLGMGWNMLKLPTGRTCGSINALASLKDLQSPLPCGNPYDALGKARLERKPWAAMSSCYVLGFIHIIPG